jgi:hypothetical protein
MKKKKDYKVTDDILDSAVQAFFQQLAADFPDIKTGDFGPYETTMFEKAALTAAQQWVEANKPRPIAFSNGYRVITNVDELPSEVRDTWMDEFDHVDEVIVDSLYNVSICKHVSGQYFTISNNENIQGTLEECIKALQAVEW